MKTRRKEEKKRARYLSEAAVNVLYLECACIQMVEGCCSIRRRHRRRCLRLPPRVLSVCALCQYWASVTISPTASSSPGTRGSEYIVREGSTIITFGTCSARAEHRRSRDLLGHPSQKAVRKQRVCQQSARTEPWAWSTTQTRKRRMNMTTTTRRRSAPPARQQRSAKFQKRPPACLLYPSRSAIYTRLLCAPARKTIHRCTAVAKG